MARKKPTPSAASWDQPRFPGKTFAFAGKWGRWESDKAQALVKGDGATVAADVTPSLDYLVLGVVTGKTTLAGKKAEKLNADGEASIRILSMAEFWDLFVPDRALAETMLRAGPPAAERWYMLQARSQVPLDFSGADLRGVQFPPVSLENVNLTGADLRQADLTGCTIKEIGGARLDGARLDARWPLRKLTDSSLVEADLSEGYLCSGEVERCDFTRANLEKFNLEETRTKQVVFHQARMSRSNCGKAVLAGADLSEVDLSKAKLVECDLSGANLSGADLTEADLGKASLKGADLRKARFHRAILCDADLTNARIDGTDFEGANLAGAKLDGLDRSRAHGLADTRTTALPTPGPFLQELDKVARQAAKLKGSASILLPDGASILVWFRSANKARTIHLESPKQRSWRGPVAVASLSAGVLDLVRPYLHGSLQLDSIKATATTAPLKPKALRQLVLAAWCEACGRAVPAEDQLGAEVEAERESQQQRLKKVRAELRGGKKSVERWNALTTDEKKHAGPFRGIDLSGAKLDGVHLRYGLDFTEANFEKASLVKADLERSLFSKARFREACLDEVDAGSCFFAQADLEGASLRDASLRFCKFQGASLKGADLSGAYLTGANLRGADLTNAKLSNDHLDSAEFDEKTRFPKGMAIPQKMTWRGAGEDPRLKHPAKAAPAAPTTPPPPPTPLTLEQFMDRLRDKIDPGRIGNALRMLKSERFQLFSQVEEGSLVGIVRSQSSAERVYSCRLASDGSFSCCTQNLRICGGLGGAICKHLLVLIVGLAKSGKVDLGAVDQWITSSRRKRPVMDKDDASEMFLKYKGVEAGEVDWRPTETIPEDFYAF